MSVIRLACLSLLACALSGCIVLPPRGGGGGGGGGGPGYGGYQSEGDRGGPPQGGTGGR